MVVNDQESRIARIETPPAQYPVNLRFTIPFYPHSLFVTVIMGREKRSLERLREERIRHPLDTWGNLACAFAMGGVLSIAMALSILFAIGAPI